MKKLDLNIERILENWDVEDAIRELIANAIDETLLTQTTGIEILPTGNNWSIRDYGRGIKPSDFTQNENSVKIKHPSAFGKFGVGLNDALATLDRKHIKIKFKSQFGDFTIDQLPKEEFPEIITLHVVINEPSSPEMIGTEILLEGITDKDIINAKNLFLQYTKDLVLDETSDGQILFNYGISKIYVNGIKVAEEPEFLFSYNITKKTPELQKSLNRERKNIGRTPYSNIIKRMLKESRAKIVVQGIKDDFCKIEKGAQHHEINSWKDIKVHAIKLLNIEGIHAFFTQEQINLNPMLHDSAKKQEKTIHIIDKDIWKNIVGLNDYMGNPICTMEQYLQEYSDSFIYEFIDYVDLTTDEKTIIDQSKQIIKMYGGVPSQVKEIKIATKIVGDINAFSDADGLWDPEKKIVIMHRRTLKSLERYCGVLIHEFVHAKTGFSDLTREFESALTSAIGIICAASLNTKKPSTNSVRKKLKSQSY